MAWGELRRHSAQTTAGINEPPQDALHWIVDRGIASMGFNLCNRSFLKLLEPYPVNSELMAASGSEHTPFMHCLPAFHNRETKVGEVIYRKFGMAEREVTDEVFESSAGIRFEQTENRMHRIKAVLVDPRASDRG